MFSLKGIPKYFPTTFHLFRNLFFVTKICEYDEINTHILSLCNIFCNITHQEIWKIDKSAHQVQTKNVLLQITVYIKHNLSNYKGNRHHVLLYFLLWLIACHLTSFSACYLLLKVHKLKVFGGKINNELKNDILIIQILLFWKCFNNL